MKDNLTQEIFVTMPIAMFNEYEISNYGTIRRKFKNGQVHYLKYFVNNSGYELVTLCQNNQILRCTVHSLVALAFLGPTPEGKEIDHVDNNKLNNRADNLQFLTREENVQKFYGNEELKEKWKSNRKNTYEKRSRK